MKLFRRYRRSIQLVLMVFALVAMTYGYLRRIGAHPLERPAESSKAP